VDGRHAVGRWSCTGATLPWRRLRFVFIQNWGALSVVPRAGVESAHCLGNKDGPLMHFPAPRNAPCAPFYLSSTSAPLPSSSSWGGEGDGGRCGDGCRDGGCDDGCDGVGDVDVEGGVVCAGGTDGFVDSGTEYGGDCMPEPVIALAAPDPGHYVPHAAASCLAWRTLVKDACGGTTSAVG